jgi:hypothetical protein
MFVTSLFDAAGERVNHAHVRNCIANRRQNIGVVEDRSRK